MSIDTEAQYAHINCFLLETCLHRQAKPCALVISPHSLRLEGKTVNTTCNLSSEKSIVCRDLKSIDEITVGFCFSFPVQHLSIKSGKIIKWTKGFQNEGAVNCDPVALLRTAFRRKVAVHSAT